MAVLLDAGLEELKVVEAVEMALSDITVVDIALAPSAPAKKGAVLITVFTNPEESLASSIASYGDMSGDARYEELREAAGLRTETIDIEGASEAYPISGPFDSPWQLVAQMPDRKVINIICHSGQLQGGELPLDLSVGIQLMSFLAQRVSPDT